MFRWEPEGCKRHGLVYSDNALLVLNWTVLNNVNALLALNWPGRDIIYADVRDLHILNLWHTFIHILLLNKATNFLYNLLKFLWQHHFPLSAKPITLYRVYDFILSSDLIIIMKKFLLWK